MSRPRRSECPENVVRVEPGRGGGLLDQPHHRLVGETLAGDLARLGDGAEQRAFGAHGGAGGPVEVGRLPPVAQPGFQRGGGAAGRLGRVGVHGDALAGAVLVGLRAGDGEQQAAAGDRLHVADA